MASRPGRSHLSRFVWLAVLIAVAVGLYTAGWFYAAGRLEAEASEALARVGRGGATAECAGLEARGYPFRIGLFCDSVSYSAPRGAPSFSAGAFRSAAQVYKPFHVIGEIDGPAELALPEASPLRLDWESLRSSLRLDRPLPERVSVAGRVLTVSPASAPTAPLAEAHSAEAHFRPRGVDADIAWSFTGLRLAREITGGRPVPLLDGAGDVAIENGVRLATERARSLRGVSGEIRSLALSSGATGVTVTGPFSFGADGLLDATLSLSVRDPEALAAVLSEIMPEAARQFETASSVVGVLGNQPVLPVVIEDGKARLGFLPLGSLSPVP